MRVIGFYGKDNEYGCFSNFFPCDFQIDGQVFHWSEQYLMLQKALLFGDSEIAEQIMLVDSPLAAKRLGKRVADFDSQVWNEKCEDLFFPGLYAKFAQNVELCRELLSTGDAILCECSPRDTIWGIGLGKSSGYYENPVNWRGRNRQGIMLMKVREQLKKDFAEEYKALNKTLEKNRTE